MKDEVPFQDFPAYEKQTKNKSKGLVVFLIIILLIAGAFGGLYFLGQNKKSESKSSITPSPTPTVEPTATPTASVSATVAPTKKVTPTAKPTPKVASGVTERSNLNVTVLNGSGVVGAGKKIADYLAGLGYVIQSTGNADNFGYEGIIVKVKKSKSDFAALLKKDLASQVASGSAVTTSVDDTISSDAQVIVGK